MKTFVLILALLLTSIFSAAIAICGAEEPPAWAYPMNPPDFTPRPEDGLVRRVPGSSATYSVTNCVIASSRRSGILAIIRPCPPSLLRVGSPTFLPAGSAIAPMGQVGQRTRVLQGFQRRISSNKWLTTRVVPGRPLCQKETWT